MFTHLVVWKGTIYKWKNHEDYPDVAIDYIILDSKVNGKKTRFAFDTGCRNNKLQRGLYVGKPEQIQKETANIVNKLSIKMAELCRNVTFKIGGEHTPYTCRTFPRFINDFGGTEEMGVSFSCPVASDMMFNLKEKMTFTDEANDRLPELNEIDAQTYFYLVKARKKAYEIVQNISAAELSAYLN